MKKSILVLMILLIPVLAIAQTTGDYSDKGAATFDKWRFERALIYFNNEVERDPNYHNAYGSRGVAKSGLGDHKGAIQDYNKAIELLGKTNLTDPLDKLVLSEDYYNRGVAKYELGDYRGAIQDFNKAIELNPNNDAAYNNRGSVKGNLGDYRGAVQDSNKAIELNPNYADAYNNRGLGKIKLGQKDSGCLDLSKAGELGYSDAYDAIKKYCQ